MRRLLSLTLSFAVCGSGLALLPAAPARAQDVAAAGSLDGLRRQYEQLLAVERNAATPPEVRELNRTFLEERRAQLAAAIRNRVGSLNKYRAAVGGALPALPALPTMPTGTTPAEGPGSFSEMMVGALENLQGSHAQADALAEVAATVEGLVAKKGNALDLTIADDVGTAHTDVTKLRQCLINLLSNAAKFTEDGRVGLTVTRDADAVLRFAVSDTGIGMNEEQVGRLFERFTQADASTTRRFGGTGLGLSISLEDAHLHGGWLQAWGEPGYGAQFRLTLPRRAGDTFGESPLPLVPVRQPRTTPTDEPGPRDERLAAGAP